MYALTKQLHFKEFLLVLQHFVEKAPALFYIKLWNIIVQTKLDHISISKGVSVP